jgi:curved DNA-binding protein CbpA
MKDYYDLLRIPRTATDAEVKQAFRRLAVLLHPDKNPHPDAPAAFQELIEAYEVLGDPAYRRKKDPNYKPPRPEPSPGYVLMMKLMPITNWVGGIAFAISLMVWLDFALPRQVLQEEVVETHRTLSHHIMTTDKGHSFDILYPQNRNFIREPLITVYASQLFSFLDYIETRSGGFQYTNVPSVFHNLMFGPLVLVILSAFGLVLPKGEAKFNISIAIAILLILNLVFIRQSVW